MRPRREARIDMSDNPRLGAEVIEDTVTSRLRQEPPVTVRAAFENAVSRLRGAGIASAHLDARILVGEALGLSREQVLTHAREPVVAAAGLCLERLLARRLAREPVSRILGRREFWSLNFALSAETLDPRPDSETVIEAALALVPRDRALSILDLGTGSGCLLLALLSELPRARGRGIDQSADAIKTATANADRLGLADRASFIRADWKDGLTGYYELIIANPPYIPAGDIAGLAPEVAEFDPRAALVGGADGLDAYRVLAPMMPVLLSHDGALVFEVGAGQAPAVAELLAAAGLTITGTRADLAGIERCVIARNHR